MADSSRTRRSLLVTLAVVLAAAGGYIARDVYDRVLGEGSRSVTLTGRVLSQEEAGESSRLCVAYDKESVRPRRNAMNAGPDSSDVGICGVTDAEIPPDTEVEGTLVLVGEGGDAYTAWTMLRARP